MYAKLLTDLLTYVNVTNYEASFLFVNYVWIKFDIIFVTWVYVDLMKIYQC